MEARDYNSSMTFCHTYLISPGKERRMDSKKLEILIRATDCFNQCFLDNTFFYVQCQLASTLLRSTPTNTVS